MKEDQNDASVHKAARRWGGKRLHTLPAHPILSDPRGFFIWGELTNKKHHILQQTTRVLTNAVYPDLSLAFTSSPFRSRVSISSTCPESAADHNPRSNSISSSVWRTEGDATWQPQSWSRWGAAMKPAVPDRWTPLVIKYKKIKLILIKNSKRPTT